MRDFKQELESQLRLAIEAETASRRRVRPSSTRLRIVALGAAAIAGTGVFAVVSAGTSPPSALALPVLVRPATAATELSAQTRTDLVRRGADLEHARSVETATGTAYVVPLADGFCLTVPDPAGGEGEACATTGEIQRRGLSVGIVPKAGGQASLVVVVPTAATVVTSSPDGTTKTQTPDAGIVATTVAAGEAVALRVGERELPLASATQLTAPTGFAACDHGARPVPIPAGMPPEQVHTLCD